jgi:uncharacterized protein (DUF3820 family)
MNPLTDTGLMPFGKYRGKPMQDVPASYLHWLWAEGKKNEVATSDVAAYISMNLHALKKEYPDGIWD